MNTPSFSDPRREREWQAQERGRLAAAWKLPAGEVDSEAQVYRLMAEVLSQPPVTVLPPDFARRVAQRAAMADPGPESRLERGGLWLSVLVLAGVALFFGLTEGGQWLDQAQRAFPSAGRMANGWGLLFVVCVGVTTLTSLFGGGGNRPIAIRQ
ncbi:hypothetical protein [Tahibacter amnicola]|uniref:Uncharacterized protein n=1 Tax=Tahibacter amnicola TaxID=2976241 RepID=A0ABY6BD18_9GAMM|nr:hypothetical protein [Tahibacter amnicola]UXI66506.1 hypothetical protein N4264_17350 [Tahibacter amnicola]